MFIDREKLKLKHLTDKTLYLLVPLILAVWAVMYLYFLSSSSLPSRLYDYEDLLHTKEHALRSTLMRTAVVNPSSAELSKIYESLSDNEVCMGDFFAAETHLEASILKEPPIDKEGMAIVWLKKANLSRESKQFDIAKVNYDRSLNYLNQIGIERDLNQAFNIAAINFNNLAVLYFLKAQQSLDAQERQKYYLNMRDYLIQAKNLMAVIDTNKNQCFRQNIEENLNQCVAEIQFSY